MNSTEKWANEIIEKAKAGERVRIGKRQLCSVICAAEYLGERSARERHQLEPLMLLEEIFRGWAEQRAAKKTPEDDVAARAYIEALGLVAEFIHIAKQPGTESEEAEGAGPIREQVRKAEYDRLLDGGVRRYAYRLPTIDQVLSPDEMELIALYRQADAKRKSTVKDIARVGADTSSKADPARPSPAAKIIDFAAKRSACHAKPCSP